MSLLDILVDLRDIKSDCYNLHESIQLLIESITAAALQPEPQPKENDTP